MRITQITCTKEVGKLSTEAFHTLARAMAKEGAENIENPPLTFTCKSIRVAEEVEQVIEDFLRKDKEVNFYFKLEFAPVDVALKLLWALGFTAGQDCNTIIIYTCTQEENEDILLRLDLLEEVWRP